MEFLESSRPILFIKEFLLEWDEWTFLRSHTSSSTRVLLILRHCFKHLYWGREKETGRKKCTVTGGFDLKRSYYELFYTVQNPIKGIIPPILIFFFFNFELIDFIIYLSFLPKRAWIIRPNYSQTFKFNSEFSTPFFLLNLEYVNLW